MTKSVVAKKTRWPTWRTSVNELMINFHECLTALIPPLKRNKIWPACYDDWDAIVETLFKNVVIRPIEFGLPGEPEGTIKFNRYGFWYEFREFSFVDVLHPSLSDDQHASLL